MSQVCIQFFGSCSFPRDWGKALGLLLFLTSTFCILYCGIYHVTLGFLLETSAVNRMLSQVAEMPKVARGPLETLAL